MTDLISRADAIEAVFGLTQLNGRVPTDSVIFQIKALPSADAVTEIYFLALWLIMISKRTKISVRGEKGENHDRRENHNL